MQLGQNRRDSAPPSFLRLEQIGEVMSNWLTFFQSYLNPGKLAAVTVPGIVIALALVLALGPVPCQKKAECPYCSTNLTPAKDSTDKTNNTSSTNLQWFVQGSAAKLSVPAIPTNSTAGQPSSGRHKTHVGRNGSPQVQQTKGPDTAGPSKCSDLPQSIAMSSATLRDITNLTDLDTAAGKVNKGFLLYAVDPHVQMPTTPGKATLLTFSTADLKSCYASMSQGLPPRTPIETIDSNFLDSLNKLREQLIAAPLPVPGQLSLLISQQKIREESTLNDVRSAAVNADGNLPADMGSNPEARNLKNSLAVIQRNGPPLGSEFCALLPRYVDSGGPSVLDASGIQKAMETAKKSNQTLVDLGSLQDLANQCKQEIASANTALAHNTGLLDKFVTQAYQDLGTLANSRISAQTAGETLVEGSITAKIEQKQNLIVWSQSETTFIKNAQDSLSKLGTRAGTIGDLGTSAPKDTSQQKSAVVDALAAIQDNLIKFLVLSLIIGQILDPLQRGAVSFFGPRRDFFIAFNEVYGPKGDGEIRYGDRRLWPWALRNNKPHEEALIAAGRAYAKDPNIYDKNYAIGAGYITQSDAQQIDNDWYTQSQLTSGLVMPMAVLSLCLGARAVCCSATASGSWRVSTAIILCSMPLAVILGGYLTKLMLQLSSPRYEQVAGGFWRLFVTPNTGPFVGSEEHRANNEAGDYKAEKTKLWSRDFWIAVFTVVAVVVGVLAIMASSLGWVSGGLSFLSLAAILLPILFVIPLWVAGLDRLHKYYSELQARIGGNILRLEATAEQKFIDLLSDDKASCAMKAKFDQTVHARNSLAKLFHIQGLNCKKVMADGDPPADTSDSSPAAQPAPADPAQPGDN